MLSLLPKNEATDTLLLYFAGHGLRRNANQGMWLLSDWGESLEGAATDVLLERLAYYGLSNVAIFSDSCRSLPKDMLETQLSAVSVVAKGPSDEDEIETDIFFAVGDGSAAFMAGAGDEARCIFSGALMEALWGYRDEAYNGDKIDGEKLGLYVRRRAREIGNSYRVKVRPKVYVGLPRDHIVYLRREGRPRPEPALRKWPLPPLAGVELVTRGKSRDVAALRKVLGKKFGDTNPSIDTGMGFSIPDSAEAALESLADLHRRPATDFIVRRVTRDFDGPIEIEEFNPRFGLGRYRKKLAMDTVAAEVEHIVAEDQDAKRHSRIVDRLSQVRRPAQKGTRGDLIVVDGEARAFWTREGVRVVQATKLEGQTDFRFERGEDGSQMLVEFNDGKFAPVVLIRRLTTVLVRDGDRIAGLYYMPADPANDDNELVSQTIEAIARMETGPLSSDETDALATELRFAKHSNPMLGVIAAYLYASVGDVASIRRMASFYVDHNQPVPYDIAFLGRMKMTLEQGATSVDVPAVLPRAHGHADLPDWVTRATDACRGRVGGRCPWLRQGWDHFEPGARDPTGAALGAVRRYLLPSTFVFLDHPGGARLVREWKLRRTP